ncbi:MAG: rod shape-determining protein MreD [Elusimicrobia bacterium]|jgi:rod shape-determining protein MreD|nr:rod shape-determining protein MreD [Elusimicrobiota bacterium]
MRILLIFFIGLVGQTLLYSNTAFSVNIDIMLIITLEISLIRGSGKAQIFGFLSGLTEDILFIGMLGEKALIRTLAGFICGKFRGEFNEGNFIFQFIITALIYLFSVHFSLFIRLILSQTVTYPPGMILSTVLNGIVAFFVYHILIKLNAV